MTDGAVRPRSGRAAKQRRQRLIRELVASRPVGNQQELVELLADHDVEVTQATVSRDIAELGLVKVSRAGGHVYASRDELGAARGDDERLRRVLADYPLRLGRSGLSLLLVSEAGTAGAIAQAIDDSTFHEQEGTIAGDNTVLVLFRDDVRLEAWLSRFEALLRGSASRRGGDGR